MIRTNVKTTDKSIIKSMDELKKQIRIAQGSYVTIGVHEGAGKYGDSDVSVVEVALWNEFGTTRSPERSFFRSALDEHESQINGWREEMMANMLVKGWSARKCLETIGFRIQTLIQNKIKSDVPPPLAASTAEHKRREGRAPVTLIDSGLLLRSITYKVYINE